MITNTNKLKMNQTLRRGQLDNIKRRTPKAKKTHKGGSHGKHK
jgi:hypothetical protein